MSKQLLVEHVVVTPSDIKKRGGKYLVESNSGGRLVITLPVTELNVKNLNERVYSTTVMESAIGKAKPQFESRELLSSVNEHPTETAYVTPGKASHVVIDAWNEGEYMYNKWEILETAAGKDLRALVEADCAFGVSIRGLGSVDNYGNILDDYEFLGTDCVADPSAQLRVKGSVVSESQSGPLLTQPTQTYVNKGSKAMKTRADLEKFLEEQHVLINADLGKSRVAAYQRLTQVEGVLSESTIAAPELAQVYRKWEGIKTEFTAKLESAPAADAKDPQALVESKQETALLKKLVEGRTKQLRTVMKSVEVMTQSLKKKTEAINQLKEVAKAKKPATTQLEQRKAVAETRKLKRSAAILKAENAELRLKLEKARFATEVAIKEAARQTYASAVAIKEAAKLAKTPKKPAAQPIAESRKPIGTKSPVKLNALSKTFEKRRKVESGEHGMQGWI